VTNKHWSDRCAEYEYASRDTGVQRRKKYIYNKINNMGMG
jgi:hypothetical protein